MTKSVPYASAVAFRCLLLILSVEEGSTVRSVGGMKLQRSNRACSSCLCQGGSRFWGGALYVSAAVFYTFLLCIV